MDTANVKVTLTRDNIVLIIVAGLASYMDAALLVSLGVALPIWTKSMSLNSWIVGFISTLLTISVAFGSFLGGKLSDAFGRSKVFNIDIFFVAIGSAVIALAHNLPVLLTGVVIAGLASGADLPTSLAVISERMSKKAYGRAIAMTQIFWTVGILLSQFIGFITAGMGAGSASVLFGWIAIVAFVNWLVRMFSPKFRSIESKQSIVSSADEEVDTKQYSLKEIFENKQFVGSLILLTIFYLFWNLPANTWGSFVNYFLVTVDHRTQAFSTIAALIANLVCLACNFIYVRMADSKLRYPLMYGGIAVAFLSFLFAGIFSSNWLIFTIAYVCYSGSTVFCGEALYKIWTQSIYPVNVRATMTGFSYGLVRAFTALFSLITPTLMGYSVKALFWTLVGCTVIFGLCANTIYHKYMKG